MINREIKDFFLLIIMGLLVLLSLFFIPILAIFGNFKYAINSFKTTKYQFSIIWKLFISHHNKRKEIKNIQKEKDKHYYLILSDKEYKKKYIMKKINNYKS